MRREKYTAETDYGTDQILSSWRWLVGDLYDVWFVTKFGDAFLKRKADGTVHWLDTESRTVQEVAASTEDFEAKCGDEENFAMWFMPDVVDAQARLGMTPRHNECLSSMIPAVLGGQLGPENIEVSDIAVHFSILGQIHQQVKDLPAGAKITKIQIVGPRRPTLLGRLWARIFGS